MKKILFILYFLTAFLFSERVNAQAPGWQWAIGAGLGSADDNGASITTDASGNIYSIGTFGSNSITIGTATLTRAGGGNTYVVKQDPSGNVIWAKSYSYSPPTFFGINSGKGICVDGSGNVYITGFYSTSLVMGTTTLTATDSSSTNYGDIYIAKLNSSGTVQWAKSAGGAVADVPNGIAVDGSGNVFVAGTFRSRYLRFGSSITLFNSFATSSNFYANTDLFVAKYDASGNPVWAKNTTTSGGVNTADGICTDASGNVIIAGTYYSPKVVFGTNTLTATAAMNLYVAKYDNSGNVIWAKTAIAGGIGNVDNGAKSVTSDASNNVYVTGANGASTLTIGSVVLNNTKGGFVAQFDASGNCQWAKSMIGNAYGTGIAYNGGNIYVTGYFDGVNCVFGTDTVKNKNTGGSNEDIFVAKYSSSGSLTWATGVGGIYRDIPNGISVDASGNANITGYTVNTSLSFGTLSLTCTGTYQDLLIAKMGNMSGIKENSLTKSIHIYPNPSSGKIVIKQDQFAGQNNSNVIITNDLGQTVFVESLNSAETELDLGHLAKGIYFIRLNDERKTLTGKFIIE